MNTVDNFKRALKWIDQNSLPNAGIAVSSDNKRAYPEVSGYFIPTLLSWNEKDRAISYGRWLLKAQHPEGCWGDPNENIPYAFDTGQILKGLLALSKDTKTQEWDEAIRNASNWLQKQIGSGGEPIAPDKLAWGDGVPLGVLLYSFEALKRAGEQFGEQGWVDSANQVIEWFLSQSNLTSFTHLSHFHAYILEALCDLGHETRAREGMIVVEKLQKKNGSVPGFQDVRWVCSTGLFQYAIVWYKLGDANRAEAAFKYAVGLQNKSGGWFGSYGWRKKYFPKSEISWAVKYYLDALRHRLISSFEKMAPIFSEIIDREDGRYQLISKQIQSSRAINILDAGCGKGRYLRNLANDFPALALYGSDLSANVMESIPENVMLKQGSLLNLPYQDKYFDFVYAVESLEHAVHTHGALKELMRVLRPGGKLVIIDKNANSLGKMSLPDWEQWFESNQLVGMIKLLGAEVEVVENVPYEGKADGLFTAWIASKA